MHHWGPSQGIQDEKVKDNQVYLPIRGISLPKSATYVSLGLCWKSGIAAEVIGMPHMTIGENLYQAKIYLSTGDLFAWTLVIIVLSLVSRRVFMTLMDRLVDRMSI